jgi:hypothetical protein
VADEGVGLAGHETGPGDGAEPVRGIPQGPVLVISEVQFGGGGVVLQLFDAGGARDRGHGGVAEHPGQCDLGRRGRMRVGDLAQHADKLADALQVLRQEQRGGGPDQVDRAAAAVIVAAQQAQFQRPVGDDQAVVCRGERQQVVLGPAVDQAVAHLVAQHPGAERLLGRPPAGQRGVADAHLADQPGLLQRADAAHDRAAGRQQGGLVDLVQVQLAGAKPVGARHRAPFGHRNGGHGRIQLGGQERRVMPPVQRLAQDLLAAPETGDPGHVAQGHPLDQGPPGQPVRVEAVDLRGVEQRDAQLQRPVDDGARLPRRVPLAVPPFQ